MTPRAIEPNAAASPKTGKGWRAFIAEDPDGDEPPEVATYCPPCADRELKPVYHAAGLRLSLAAAAVKLMDGASFGPCS